MAAQTFKIYNLAKKKLGNTTINLASAAFRMALYASASDAPTLTKSLYASLASEVATGNGYTALGKTLANETWTVGSAATKYRFDFDDVVWTATGGTIPNIKYAVVFASGTSANRHLLAVSSLTSSQFTLSQNNTLTLQIAAAGCFNMS